MADQNFIDNITLHITSGKGGPGSISFRKEKFTPKGGPNGGNGGNGGNIIIQGNQQLTTLTHLKKKQHITAENGHPGQKSTKTGKNGKHTTITLPIGTTITNKKTNKKIAQITKDKQKITLLKGGKGGLGNQHFKTPTIKTPRHAQPGKPAQKATIKVEIKITAQIAIIGTPNTGKSTLLTKISNAKPTISHYPFTTTIPNLGILKHNQKTFTIIDIPPITQHNSTTKYLKHIENSQIILHIIDINSKNITQEYNTTTTQLKKHNPKLLNKNNLIIISKADTQHNTTQTTIQKQIPPNTQHIITSSHTQQGIQKLKQKIYQLLTSK